MCGGRPRRNNWHPQAPEGVALQVHDSVRFLLKCGTSADLPTRARTVGDPELAKVDFTDVGHRMPPNPASIHRPNWFKTGWSTVHLAANASSG